MNRTDPLCSSDNSAAPALRYSAVNRLLKACAGCGLVYLENPPEYGALQAELTWEESVAAERKRRRDAEPFEIVRRTGFRIVRFSLRDRFPRSDNMWAVCQAV